jgi:arginine-tRNA-protein transferase
MTAHPQTPQFFLTSPTPCPYLPGQLERKVFTHLVGEKAPELLDLLTQGGFRRSQNIAYRPACERCRACMSVRIVVDEFEPTKSMRRVMARNRDIVGRMDAAVPSSEQYSLFRRYLDDRHAKGGMSEMSVLDYAMMVEDSQVDTRLIQYRMRGPDSSFTRASDGALIGAALSDVMGDGMSMVYSFFEPGEHERGLGTFMILDHIERTKRLGLPYLYLGYWVKGSRKMDYKVRYQPQEHLQSKGWERYKPGGAAQPDRGDAETGPADGSRIAPSGL